MNNIPTRNLLLVLAALSLCCLIENAESANILALLPSSSPSHVIFEISVARQMAMRHHNVTIISVLPLKEDWLHPSMKHIKLDKGLLDMTMAVNSTQYSGLARVKSFMEMYKTMIVGQGDILDDPKMKELIYNTGNNFDLILWGYFAGDYFFGLAEHFDCPVVLLWPNIPIIAISNLMGNPLEMSYTVTTMMNMAADTTGFGFRLKNVLANAVESVLTRLRDKWSKPIYEKYFPSDKYVSYEKAKERVSLVLFSHHFSEKPVRPLVPGMIEIGGIHLDEETKPLPKDIEEFVSAAEHGVIFFSLGTNVKAKHLQPQTLEKVFNVLSKLPQRVLWKCDDESNVPGNSTNILYRKWLPQADILGHPKTVLFFCHGGKGGITEAKFYGVPMVGLPIFGDQPMNMEEVVMKGYGLSIEHDESLSEEVIRKTVKEVLENTSYRNNVRQFSNLYRDRPLKIKDNAVYWLEYVIRYKGAPHMQSPLKTMSFVEANNLDAYACILLVFYIIALLVKLILKLIINLVCRKCMGKSKRD
ncbi:UDP-glycosyltransferase UGT5 isoform X1 [Musca domestica]|uniref:UDP-glycosyltransferase UGT5 isoform X1 n=1 Tax=Musca domestica TaxID=7370 RepID=A0A9J7I6Y0_MUSDO|nr:UDP-glycosyltransferase UGT5 isoform X1 [Musca domestica]